MNWLFDAYSNVYGTAMMQALSGDRHAANAKERHDEMRAKSFLGFLGRR